MIKFNQSVFNKVFSLGLAVAMGVAPVLTYAETVQRPDDWATLDLYKAETSGILPLNWQQTLHDQVTSEQIQYIIKGLEKKLEQAGLQKEHEMTQGNCKTRYEVLDTYYRTLKQYGDQIELEGNMLAYMKNNKIVSGDNEGNIQLDKRCTLQEATLFANRILENTYKQLDAGARGYLWEVKNGNKTVYLLGTVHVKNEEIYPFHHILNGIIEGADKIAFEVDFNDQRGYAYLLQKQMYMDGTTLQDHISPELYKETVEIMKGFGISEIETMKYKPWALSNAISGLAASKNSSESKKEEIALPIIDSYVYTASLLQDKDIIELEGYRFQANMYDSISQERQVKELEQNIKVVKEEAAVEEEAITLDTVKYWVEAFIKGDEFGFNRSYDKDQMLQQQDEMMKMLFVDRDRHMTQKVEEYLKTKDNETYLVVVGAAHMIGENGIVNQLKEKGYKVRAIE